MVHSHSESKLWRISYLIFILKRIVIWKYLGNNLSSVSEITISAMTDRMVG